MNWPPYSLEGADQHKACKEKTGPRSHVTHLLAVLQTEPWQVVRAAVVVLRVYLPVPLSRCVCVCDAPASRLCLRAAGVLWSEEIHLGLEPWNFGKGLLQLSATSNDERA